MKTYFNFENPHFLWLLALVPIIIIGYYYTRNQSQASLTLSTTKGFSKNNDLWIKLKPVLDLLPVLAYIFLVIAIARPRTQSVEQKTKNTQGIDIVLAVDISLSMYSKDLKPNRLEALKKVAGDFIQKRTNDRISLVVYSGESYTRVPLTTDKDVLLAEINKLGYDKDIKQGTAIGLGLATSVNRLKASKAKSKVIILLTDGSNNAGFVPPKTAAELAAAYNIKTYTIGVGSKGFAKSPVAMDRSGKFIYDKIKVDLDADLLKEIAKITKGIYFRATDNEKLKYIYNEIDMLETTEIETIKFFSYDEHYRFWTSMALACVIIVMTLRYTIYRSFI